MDRLRARGVSENTIKAYSSDVADLLGFLTDGKLELNLDGLREWMYAISEAGATKSTLARKTSSAKAFTSFLYERGELDADPGLRLRAPKLDRSLPKVASEASLAGVFESLIARAESR